MFIKKFVPVMLILVFVTASCQSAAELPTATVAATNTLHPTDTQIPTDTPTSTPTLTLTPTFTLTPTETQTPTPSPTPLGGGSGYFMMVSDLNVVQVPVDDPSDSEIVVNFFQFILEFGVSEISSLRSNTVSPHGDTVAIWNCSSSQCDTRRGPIYLFTTDFKKKVTVDVPGYPAFIGWSADQDRLLYYLGSTMADDYFLIKTKGSDFGDVIELGQMRDVAWAPDRQTLYAQKGSTVYQLDLDGNELQTWTCMYNDDCIHAPSPDGKRFAGIQKHVPTGAGNPTITITNQDFSEKETLFISDNKALIISVQWLPDNQHLLVYGETARQRTRAFWRLDYLSIIDVETGEERVIELDIPEDSESFSVCGVSPDGTHMIYLGVGGRVKQEGRIYMSGRYAYLLPIWSDKPEFIRITDSEDSWEGCPAWVINHNLP